MDEGNGATPEDITEIHRATDLSLRATKQRGWLDAVWQVWWQLSATCG